MRYVIKKLLHLKPGEITELMLLKDKDQKTGDMKDAVFMFGQVTKIDTNHTFKGFEEWLIEKRHAYESIY